MNGRLCLRLRTPGELVPIAATMTDLTPTGNIGDWCGLHVGGQARGTISIIYPLNNTSHHFTTHLQERYAGAVIQYREMSRLRMR